MSKGYEKADKEVIDVMKEVMRQYHPDLVEAEVRVGVVMVSPEIDKEGEETGPAISKNGHRAVAKIRLISQRDRLHQPFDAMIDIDEKVWPTLTCEQQEALMDHNLTALTLIEGKEGEKFSEADDGRPRLKLRKEDFLVSGYEQVIKRHRDAALEYRAVKAVWDRLGQGRFAFAADFGDEKKAKRKDTSPEPGQSEEHQLSEARERESRRGRGGRGRKHRAAV